MLASRRSANCALSAFPSHILLPTSDFQPPPRHRSYATEANLNLEEEYTKWPSHPLPTPYQIFHYSQQTPYSKSRYFQLVKLYHPDHAQHRQLHITEAVRLERFRLVVAANAILSDPAKRAAYDRFGLGWNVVDTPQVRRWWREREGHSPSGFGNEYGKGGYNDPSRNATWEDWEKYYQRKAASEAVARGEGGKYHQETLYTSNRAFIMIIAFLASLGGLANISRANVNGNAFLEETDRRSAQISRDLQRRRREVSQLGSKDERIQYFLKSRDPVGYGLIDPQEERVKRILPPGERCISDDIQKRNLGN